MKKTLKDKFKKVALRTTLLVSLPFLGFGVMADAMANDSNQFNQQKYDICSFDTTGNNPISAIAIDQQFMMDEALSTLNNSPLAFTYLIKQNDKLCLPSYDVPITNNKLNKGELLFTLADKLVDKDLTSRGYPDKGRRGGIEGEFRTAMRMALTAQILTELNRNGDSEPLKAALKTDFGQVFKSFQHHDDNDIYNGKATIHAIQNYFKITKHHHKHKISSNGINRLYNMGKRPDAPNIFEEIFSNKQDFNLRYLTGDKTTDNIYNRGHRY